MKIVLNDINDVEDFLSMLSPDYFDMVRRASAGCRRLAGNMPAVDDGVVVPRGPISLQDEPAGLPQMPAASQAAAS